MFNLLESELYTQLFIAPTTLIENISWSKACCLFIVYWLTFVLLHTCQWVTRSHWQLY